MVQVSINVTPEARACAINANAEELLSLIAACESRTSLDVRGLTNMKGGRLKVHNDEAGDYADSLKAIDAHFKNADAAYVLAMPHAASTYASVLLDLVQDAVDLYATHHPPAAHVGGGGGTGAADIAAALAVATEHSRLEVTKECTTTYEQERHANMMRLYKLTLDESEHGNRSALYKAHKHMGKDSSHQYPIVGIRWRS